MSFACEQLYDYFKQPNFDRIIKEDGIDPFKHPVVKKWHRFFIEYWKSNKEIALLLPCTVVKPYSLSPTHKIAYSNLKKYNLEDKVQVYSVSEPMLLVPRELENCYPFNSYDYPPSKMSSNEKEEFIDLLSIALKHISAMHRRLIAVLPRHHYEITEKASKKAGVLIEMHGYGRLSFKTISSIIKDISMEVSLKNP
ncbi:DUF5591 domain-containing protein [Sulfolobus tengchongensis]|uniref:DUF5591 domain-containing protein n=1 Tax=Sulfolobus tengchongensis TaxID=207809 RepID=A0AAX4L2U4_9CREN